METKPYIILHRTESGAACIWDKGGYMNHTVMIADRHGKPKTPIHVVKGQWAAPNKRHALFPVDIGDIIAIGQETDDAKTSFKTFYEVVALNVETHSTGKIIPKAILKPVSWLRMRLMFGAFYRAFNAKLKTFECKEVFYSVGTHNPQWLITIICAGQGGRNDMEPRLDPPTSYWDDDYDEDWRGDDTYEEYEVTLRDTEKALDRWERYHENNRAKR